MVVNIRSLLLLLLFSVGYVVTASDMFDAELENDSIASIKAVQQGQKGALCCGKNIPHTQCDQCCKDERIGCSDPNNHSRQCQSYGCARRSPPPGQAPDLFSLVLSGTGTFTCCEGASTWPLYVCNDKCGCDCFCKKKYPTCFGTAKSALTPTNTETSESAPTGKATEASDTPPETAHFGLSVTDTDTSDAPSSWPSSWPSTWDDEYYWDDYYYYDDYYYDDYFGGSYTPSTSPSIDTEEPSIQTRQESTQAPTINSIPTNIPSSQTRLSTGAPDKGLTPNPSVSPTRQPIQSPYPTPKWTPPPILFLTRSPTSMPAEKQAVPSTGVHSSPPKASPVSDELSERPSEWPSFVPSMMPSIMPSMTSELEPPTTIPSMHPTTVSPTFAPTSEPTRIPTSPPTTTPSSAPTKSPTTPPSDELSEIQTPGPTRTPSGRPTPVSEPTNFPSPTTVWPTVSPTESCRADIFYGGCVADTTASFDADVVLKLESPFEPTMESALLTNVPIVFDALAGSTCDACRRRVLDTELVSVSTNNTENEVVVKLTMGQIGGCDTAFDTNEKVVTMKNIWDFLATCGTFVPFGDSTESQSCCCATCTSGGRRTEVTGEISRSDFGIWLGMSLNVQITSVLEVINSPVDSLNCDPEQNVTTTSFIYISLDYVLDHSDYDVFSSLLRTAYNQLSVQNCFPQRLLQTTVLEDVGTGHIPDDRRRELGQKRGSKKMKKAYKKAPHIMAHKKAPCADKASCIKVQVERACYGDTCPVKNGMCELFGDCTRRLTETTDGLSIVSSQSSSIKRRTFDSQRHLQSSPSSGDNACLCLVGGDMPAPTFEPPSAQVLLDSLDTLLIAQGLGQIGDIHDAKGRRTGPNSKGKLRRRRKKRMSGKGRMSSGKGSQAGKGSKGNAKKKVDVLDEGHQDKKSAKSKSDVKGRKGKGYAKNQADALDEDRRGKGYAKKKVVVLDEGHQGKGKGSEAG